MDEIEDSTTRISHSGDGSQAVFADGSGAASNLVHELLDSTHHAES